MAEKLNCWEFKRCGREPGGSKVAELGVCSAASGSSVRAQHGGVNGGRACWVISGTLCGGERQGTFAQKLVNCMACDFYLKVRQEEGSSFLSSRQLLGL